MQVLARAALLLALLASPFAAGAQTVTGTVTGIVKDASGRLQGRDSHRHRTDHRRGRADRLHARGLNTRNVYGLIFLTPGVAGTIGNAYGDLRYTINGARPRSSATLVDGVTATFPTVTGGAGISVFPSVDAIQEFKVLGATYPAEFGRSLGSTETTDSINGATEITGANGERCRARNAREARGRCGKTQASPDLQGLRFFRTSPSPPAGRSGRRRHRPLRYLRCLRCSVLDPFPFPPALLR